MSAINTALNVIEWAMLAAETRKPPPQGDLQAVEQLAQPPELLCQSLGKLVALTSARLKLSQHPFGDRRALSANGLMIAAAIGVAMVPELARILLRGVSQPTRPIDWVTHHALIAPALSFLPNELGDDLKLLSPLTALLTQPVLEQTQQPFEVARQMLGHPAERELLIQSLAQPTSDMGIRRWRTEVLHRLRNSTDLAEQSSVLDIYEAMMVHHQQAAIAQVRAAYAVMTNPTAARDEYRLQDALSVAKWWEPLWAIERADLESLRKRRYLGYNYREGFSLLGLSRKLTGGVL